MAITLRPDRAPVQQRPERSRRNPLFLAAVAALLAIWYGYPQPTLDEGTVARLAAEHVGNAPPLRATPEGALNGTIVVITGATSGIGLGLATKLHGWGGTIVAIGRSSSKLERLRAALDGDRDVAEDERRLIPVIADLNDLASVASASEEIRGKIPRVDFLVNNAGMHYSDFSQGLSTAQGFDMVFGVNYLSHFLLTEKLLPLLQKSNRNPRIIQVSSSFHWLSGGDELASDQGKPPYAAQTSRAFFHGLRSYPNSKLAQILHARALSRELAAASSHVKVVSACPGWVGTSIAGSFAHQILSHVAFPPDGFGLSSILSAMFQPRVEAEGVDWVVNLKLFHVFGRFFTGLGLNAGWTSTTGFRDLLVWIVAVTCLHTQKFFGKVIWSESSSESYDIELQDSLYKWSKDLVSEWL